MRLKQLAADVEMVLQRSCHSAHTDTICVLATALSDAASGMQLPLGGLTPSLSPHVHACSYFTAV